MSLSPPCDFRQKLIGFQPIRTAISRLIDSSLPRPPPLASRPGIAYLLALRTSKNKAFT
jgi:hypothetical protein